MIFKYQNFFIIFLLVCITTNCFSQKLTIKKIDSLCKILEDNDAFVNLGHKKILQLSNDVYINSKKNNYERGQLVALKKIIETDFNTNQLKDADSKIPEAIQLAEKLNDTQKLVSLIDYKAKYLIHLGFYKEAREKLNLALSLSTKISDKDKMYIMRASIFNDIGSVFEELSAENKNNLDSLYYYVDRAYVEAKMISTNNPKRNRLVAQYARVNGASLLYAGRYDDATKYFAEAEKLLLNEKDTRYIVPVYRFLGEVEYKKNHLEKSIDYFQKAIVLAEKSEYYTELVFLYPAIASPYKDLKNFEKSTYYLNLSRKLNEKIELQKKSNVEKVSIENNKEEKKESQLELYILAGLMIVLSIALGLYLRFKLKNKKTVNTFESKQKNIIGDNNADSIEDTDKHPLKNIDAEQIKYLIDLARNNDESFYLKFLEVFPYFNKKLLSISPNLSMSDLEYCALIKLDFNTKEIAQAKDISIRTVESKKYRLRKKLNLPEDIKNINIWFSDF